MTGWLESRKFGSGECKETLLDYCGQDTLVLVKLVERLRIAIDLVDVQGPFTVVDDQGNPRVTATGDPLPVSEFFREFGNSKPFLVRSNVVFGTGQGGSTNASIPATKPLSHYFGPNSLAADTNRLSLRDPAYTADFALRLLSKGW